MPKSRLTIATAVLVLLVLFVQLVCFQVRETERAVVKTFGRATRDVREPGLYAKWPWPVEQVVRLDARLRVLEGPLEETVTEDKRSVLVACFVTWRIGERPGDPQRFLEALGSVQAAESRLEGMLRNAQSAAFGSFPFSALVTTERSQLRWDEVESRIQGRLVKTAREELGIEVPLVGIRRLALPKDTTESVFARMRREREVKAAEYLAQGQADADAIRAEADRFRDTELNAAHAEARKLLGEAERANEKAYRTLEEDPELAIFLRKIEALKRALAGRTTLVLDTGSAPFDLLAPRAPVTSQTGEKK